MSSKLWLKLTKSRPENAESSSPAKNHLAKKSECKPNDRKIDPGIRDLNSYVPDFLKNKPAKASREIFAEKNRRKMQNIKQSQQNLQPGSHNTKIDDQISWSEDFSKDQDDLSNDFSGFLEQKYQENPKIPPPQIISTPLDYYQGFRVKNLEIIESLDPHFYAVTQDQGGEKKGNMSFHSNESIEDAKFVNFDKENLENANLDVAEGKALMKGGQIDKLIEIEVLMKNFEEIHDKSFEDYERVIVTSEEYDNLILKKNQNHASFAFISLVFLKKMLRKFMEACFCIESFLKADNLLPQIPQLFVLNFRNQIEILKNWDFKNLDLDLLLNPEGSFSANLAIFANSLQALQKVLNHAKIVFSSMSSSKSLEGPFKEMHEKIITMGIESKKESKSVLKLKSRTEGKQGRKPREKALELLRIFGEMKNLLINSLNLSYRQNFTVANVREKLGEKEEALPEKLEREINHNKSEEVIGLVSKVWALHSENKDFFTTLETEYISLLKILIQRSENSYFRYFKIYQNLSFSMESLRKLCQLNLEEIKLLELETKEILEKSIVKLEFPLGKHSKSNEAIFLSIEERRNKLLSKVLKLKRETKELRKNLKNEHFYLLYLQKCDETLLKVSQIHHNLKYFADVLGILKESITLESLFSNLPKNAKDFENQDLSILKRVKSQFIHVFQLIQPYKNRVSLIKQTFPIFFEIEKELYKELEVIEMNLRKINEIIEGKSPEFLEIIEKEIEITELLLEKLRQSLTTQLSLREYLRFIMKNQQIDYDLSSKMGYLRKLTNINGLKSENKAKLTIFIDELSSYLASISLAKVILRTVQHIKPERVRKLLLELRVRDIFEEKHREEKLEDWLKELDHQLKIIKTTTDPRTEEMLNRDGFREILLLFYDVYRKMQEDYSDVVTKIKSEIINERDYSQKAVIIRGEIAATLEKITLKKDFELIFLNPKDVLAIVDSYFKENIALFANQANSLNKLSRKQQVISFRESTEKLKANFLEKGIKEHTDAKLQEMTSLMVQAKKYLQEFKNEILRFQKEKRQGGNNNYTVSEVKELVFMLKSCIKSCLFMISLGGFPDLYLTRIQGIKDSLQKAEEGVMEISQKIKEAATDFLQVKKRIHSAKTFVGTEFEDLYSQGIDLIMISSQHLSIVYELLGDLAHFDGIFNEFGFELIASSQNLFEGVSFFLEFTGKYPAKKRELIEILQKLGDKVNHKEFLELPKPLEGINIIFFKIIEDYVQEFDIDYLKFLEPKLKILTENYLHGISTETLDLVEAFMFKSKENDEDSNGMLNWLKTDIPKITQKIKNVIEVLDSDLSYKSFGNKIGSNKLNRHANKMLSVENINECMNIVDKEKFRNWETILLTIYNVINVYLTDRANDKLKNLNNYKEKLFGLKKINHGANKEMNFISVVENIIKLDFKMNEKVI